ncbi:hypothetical protein H4R33_005457, partial [Dimargaris cristalligena]
MADPLPEATALLCRLYKDTAGPALRQSLSKRAQSPELTPLPRDPRQQIKRTISSAPPTAAEIDVQLEEQFHHGVVPVPNSPGSDESLISGHLVENSPFICDAAMKREILAFIRLDKTVPIDPAQFPLLNKAHQWFFQIKDVPQNQSRSLPGSIYISLETNPPRTSAFFISDSVARVLAPRFAAIYSRFLRSPEFNFLATSKGHIWRIGKSTQAGPSDQSTQIPRHPAGQGSSDSSRVVAPSIPLQSSPRPRPSPVSRKSESTLYRSTMAATPSGRASSTPLNGQGGDPEEGEIAATPPGEPPIPPPPAKRPRATAERKSIVLSNLSGLRSTPGSSMLPQRPTVSPSSPVQPSEIVMQGKVPFPFPPPLLQTNLLNSGATTPARSSPTRHSLASTTRA